MKISVVTTNKSESRQLSRLSIWQGAACQGKPDKMHVIELVLILQDHTPLQISFLPCSLKLFALKPFCWNNFTIFIYASYMKTMHDSCYVMHYSSKEMPIWLAISLFSKCEIYLETPWYQNKAPQLTFYIIRSEVQAAFQVSWWWVSHAGITTQRDTVVTVPWWAGSITF